MTLFQSFRDYLERRYPEIQVTIEPEQWISFSLDSFNFRFNYHPQDANYFRLMLPRVAVPGNVEIDRLCKIACEVSAGYKVGQIELINNEFWICYEQLIVNTDVNNDLVYDFSIRVLRTMITVFRERVNALVH